MKKLLLFMIALLTGVSGAWAQDGTVVATMSDLVTGAGFNNAKTVKENSIYSCAYNTYLGAIDNSAVTTAYEGEGYVTVAMWIWGNSASGCLFGYGDQGTGVMYYINGATVRTTTKTVADLDAVDLGSGRVAANQWNLIAFAIPAENGSWNAKTARYYATATDATYWTISSKTKMNTPASGSKKCAIGSGNQGNARDAFNGIIANVTVIQSTALLNNSRIAALVGPAPSSTVWYKPAMGGRTWTWNTTNSNYDSSDGTAPTGTPARTTSEGPVYRFNSVGTLSATSSSNVDTSDKGGAWVLGTQQNSSNVTVNIGRWAGSIDVETWQVANVSYSVDLKGTEPSCCSTVWVDGDLTFGSSRSSCSINDGGDQRWYIGENGIIHSSFTSVSKGSREWNFQIVVANDPQVGETDTRIVHTRTRKVMTWGADIHSNIDNVKVFHKEDDGTLTEKNTTNDTNFKVTYDANGMYVTYTCKGYFNTNDPNYTYTYSSGVGTAESRVSINHNGGTVNLTGAEETYYLGGSNSGTQTTVNFDGTTVNYSNELGIGKATYNIHNTSVTTPRFITSQGYSSRAAEVNLTGNTVITVTGSTNEDTNQSSIMIGHWSGSSDVTLSGTAKIEAVDAQLLVGKTGNTQTITLNGSSNITAKGIKAASNASGTNTLNLNGGSLDLGDVGITSYSNSRSISVNVTENSTITASASTLPISQPITIAAGKTLTIDGDNHTVDLESAPAPSLGTGSTINFIDATVTLNVSDRNLSRYTFTSCTATAKFVETGTEYAAGGFTITNVPSGVTIKVKKYGASDYETVTPEAGTATFSHSVEVSGSAAWLDYTFDETTLATNQPATPIGNIPNRGNAGSGQTLTIDNSQTSAVSYNADGTFKVRYTPYRNMTWPENYTVAVSGNFPDVENGCLVAFGTKAGNYLALIRGANSNEIKLVKGQGNNTYTNIQTMAAENATAAAHLVVFTKQGNVFKVYCDGVNVATTTYDQTLGGGLQVGSIHGGYANTGVVSVMDNSLTDDQKNAVFCNAIRVYDYIISNAQMDALKSEFPYVSQGGNYTRTISANANLDAEDAWYNVGEETNTNLPTNNIVEEVTYYPDIVVTTTAASTLTVNANMDSRNIEFDGAGKLTIASDGTHSISIKGSVTANGSISVKYGAIDMSAVPVSIGEDGSIEFDFSDYDFSGVTTSTDYPVTGNTSDYGAKVTGVYPSDIYHTYTLTHNGSSNNYILTVAPSVALKQQQAIALVTPYYNGNHVGAGLGKYTISLGETSYANMKDFGDAVTAWATLGDCVEPTIVLNLPTAGMFLRIKSRKSSLIATPTYLTSSNIQIGKYYNSAYTQESSKIEGAETILYYDASNHLFGYSDGMWLWWDASVADWFFDFQHSTVPTAVVFEEAANKTIGEANIKVNGSKYFNTISDANGIYAECGATASSDDYNFSLEEATSLPVTISTVKWATLYSPVALTIPSGVKAYYISSLTSTEATLTEIATTIAANTPVILKSTEEYTSDEIAAGGKSYSFAITTGGTDVSASNKLSGQVAAQAFEADYAYTLQKNRADPSIVGLYPKAAGTMAGFRAYLLASEIGALAKGFTFKFEDVDGISTVQDAGVMVNGSEIFNLAGQRMNRVQKGVNIVNGKKVLVK